MPPRPRNRVRNSTQTAGAGAAKTPRQAARAKNTSVPPPRRKTLFDSIDAASTPGASSANTKLVAEILDSEDDESSLSSLSSSEPETALPSGDKGKARAAGNDDDEEDDSEDEDEDIEFEDVQAPFTALQEGPAPSATLELTLFKDTRMSLINDFGKRGPTKRDRLTRNGIHRMHVLCLLWANATRNAWLCDPLVQGIMLSHLPVRLWDEVERWRRASGLEGPQNEPPSMKRVPVKGKGMGEGKSGEPADRSSRDWGVAARRLGTGEVDMSHGDPLIRLMKALSAFWKQRFNITAPGIRKVGYMSLERLDRLTRAFKKGPHDASKYGEQIRDLEAFRQHAQDCNGSRDVGAQLFTALLRGLGLEARMVASLQPLGFGWTKPEDADPEAEEEAQGDTASEPEKPSRDVPSRGTAPIKPKGKRTSERTLRRGGQKRQKVDDADLDDSELREINSDDDLIVEVPQKPAKRRVQFDTDLEYPHYWTEVLSPVTRKFLVVEPMVKSLVATNRELVESLEPRGGQADKKRQVMAYVIGYSQDGTAKDVTVRYLKRQTLPGKTKGMRYPVTKVPVRDENGKVQRYSLVDWTKAAMRGYSRGTKQHPITDMDEDEDASDLRPAKPEKKVVKSGEETLQYYKQSKEYVLERHLKREEALAPGASPVSVFTSKAKGGKTTEENVYLRKDIAQVKSAETWHKQGRAPKPGEMPLKSVPYRAATINRKREIAMAEARGQKVLQGLYSFDQTDWIIPPPIKDGIIPKNEYGNIDLFVEHMCPKGAVHVPYRGVVKVCKRLNIDYAEAVIDFEFGHRMAVPVIQGVVIAEEHHDRAMQELAKDEAERTRKEDEKRQKAAMRMWRRMLMGMRLLRRLREEYGDENDDGPIFGRGARAGGGGGNSSGPTQPEAAAEPSYDEDTAGGFLPEGFDEEEALEAASAGEEAESGGGKKGSYFPVPDEQDGDEEDDGGLMIEDGRLETALGTAARIAPRPLVVSQPSPGKRRPSRQAAVKANSKMSQGSIGSDSET